MKKCAPLNGCGCHFLPLTGWVRPNGSDVSQRRLFESAAQGCPNASRQRQGIGLLPEGIARRRARSGTCPPLPLVSASGAIPLAVFPSPLFLTKTTQDQLAATQDSFLPSQTQAAVGKRALVRRPILPRAKPARRRKQATDQIARRCVRTDRAACSPRFSLLPNQDTNICRTKDEQPSRSEF